MMTILAINIETGNLADYKLGAGRRTMSSQLSILQNRVNEQDKRIAVLEQRIGELEAVLVEAGWMDNISTPPTRTNAPKNWRYSISPSPYSILSVEEPHL